ncbi:MAG: hypothetical protein CR972_05300 [Candidatus Moraniibacteriota bacterium]|nr:MAG: hypothetical protein CR972_05300 [Candidatus Moranbacteria bacterium]
MWTKKHLISFVCIVVAYCVTAAIVVRASQVGGAYIVELVRAEQEEHYHKMRADIAALSAVQGDVLAYVDIMQVRQLTGDEQKTVAEILRQIEENGLSIARHTLFYFEDTTVHMFFPPRAEIERIFDEAHNTQLYVNRCVRFVEMNVYNANASRAQKEMMRKNCALLSDEIARLQSL